MTKEELELMLCDIEKYGGLAPEGMAIVRQALEGYYKRCQIRYPYYSYFTIATGKKYGDIMETRVRNSFNGWTKPKNDTSYDALTPQKERIEIKSLRACSKGQTQIFLKQDRVSPSKFSTSSYQQTKPSCCDWFVFHILFGDGSRLFVIPSKMVSQHPGEANVEPGKIPLISQHRDHQTEGQVYLGQVLKYAKYFEINDYDLEKKYDFASFQEEITQRLDEINWQLPR